MKARRAAHFFETDFKYVTKDFIYLIENVIEKNKAMNCDEG